MTRRAVALGLALGMLVSVATYFKRLDPLVVDTLMRGRSSARRAPLARVVADLAAMGRRGVLARPVRANP